METVINRPYDFRTLRIEKDKKGRKRYCYVAMTKSLHNLWRYLQVGEAANRRYLNALAAGQLTGVMDRVDAVATVSGLPIKHGQK